MKKLFLFLVVVSTSICGYSQESMSNRVATPNCWPGEHLALVYSYDFYFHRPVRNCQRGFWFCFTNGHYEWACVPNSNRSISNDGKNYVYIDISDDYFTFRFPISLKLDSNYTLDELKTFNVDESLIFTQNKNEYQLVKGDYATTESDTEIIAKVPVIKLK